MLTSCQWAIGQLNLVPNPSFEDYTICPNSQGQVERAYPWFNPTNSSPDYMNACATIVSVDVPKNNWGYQYARTGQAYMGVFACDDMGGNRREYIEVELTDTLQNGHKYTCYYYVALSMGNSDGVCNNMGFCLTNDSLIDYSTIRVLNGTPVFSYPTIIYDTLNWTKIEFTFTASGGERFLTIGNFYPDSLTQQYNFYDPSDTVTFTTTYFYIDDVFLGEYIPPVDTSDTTVVLVEPAINPNPASDHLLLSYNLAENETGIFVLYNSLGQVVLTKPLETFNGTKTVYLPTLASGVYIASLILNNTEVLQKKMVVAK